MVGAKIIISYSNLFEDTGLYSAHRVFHLSVVLLVNSSVDL